jgi:hypothetical protein
MASTNELLRIGFKEVGEWESNAQGLRYCLSDPGVGGLDQILYAFAVSEGDVEDGDVVYIGKTTRSMNNRFIGYVNPGNSQQTNQRIHTKVKHALDENRRVKILLFEDVRQLQWAGFDLNVAAGIEDSLIKKFQPQWNRAGVNRPVQAATQEIESEYLGVENDETVEKPSGEPLCSQQMTVGKTYFQSGFMNFNPVCSNCLGDHESIISLYGDELVLSARINRNAVPNRSVRVNWGRELARWYQSRLAEGDVINVDVYPDNRVVIR